MQLTYLSKEVILIESDIHRDDRGYFTELYNNLNHFEAFGINHDFHQDNLSMTKKTGTIRGLHWQEEPHEQGKLVSVIRGSVFDVAVDIRPDSPTFGQWVGAYLSPGFQLWIPPGHAHGFQCYEPNTIFHYKCTNRYHQESERSIDALCPTLSIKWPIKEIFRSSKDELADDFRETFFE